MNVKIIEFFIIVWFVKLMSIRFVYRQIKSRNKELKTSVETLKYS